VLFLAHRGANRLARENTITAFVAAASIGADGVELDVQLSADGVVVVHHDHDLAGLGAIGELTAAELPDWVPTLGAALDACAGLALVNVEIKDPTAVLPTAALLTARPNGQPAALVSSFDLASIDDHHCAAPGVPTAWLTLPGRDQAAALATAAEHGHAALHPHCSVVTAELVGAAHDRGLRIGTWTVNEPDQAATLAAMGVDVLISDVPDVVRPRA
jgi:glycerophosphoryl diester phosphodiesterase